MKDAHQPKEINGTVKGSVAHQSASYGISLPAVPALQRKGLEDEELQMKSVTQLAKAEEEELQMKAATQLAKPDEKELQMKSIVQLAKPEEELQMKSVRQLKNNISSDVSQRKENMSPPRVNRTGMPDQLKAGIENLSGFSMDDVKVHYNSSQPAQLNALAYAQGTNIHIGPGQERYLPHEAWHMVQQKQGRVRPTTQMKGTAINDDKGLEKEADVMGGKAGKGIEKSKDENKRLIQNTSQEVSVIQPVWNDGATNMNTLKELEDHVKVPSDNIEMRSEAAETLLSDSQFRVPPAATLSMQILGRSNIRVMPNDKNIVGESEHGTATWNNATDPWSNVPKMRERYKTYEKPGEESIAEKDRPIEYILSGEERENAGDFALEGQNEYAISALSIVQQFLKGYDQIYDLSGLGSQQVKNDWYSSVYDRVREVYVILLRYHKIGEGLFSKVGKTQKEKMYVDLALHICADDGYEQVKKISDSNAQGRITELGGWRQRNLWKRIEVIQKLIHYVIQRIIQIDSFQNTDSITALNEGEERNRDDWSSRVKQAVESPATRDIRENEMVRRINAGPVPLLVQVGAAHINGLKAKGAGGVKYNNEANFIAETTKKIKSPHTIKLEEDQQKHRALNFWG